MRRRQGARFSMYVCNWNLRRASGDELILIRNVIPLHNERSKAPLTGRSDGLVRQWEQSVRSGEILKVHMCPIIPFRYFNKRCRYNTDCYCCEELKVRREI